jgi:hypothetical protein
MLRVSLESHMHRYCPQSIVQLNALRSYFAGAAFSVCIIAGGAFAQTPGNWKYTIATDPNSVPADMRVNFPTVTFNACLTAADFESGRAFGVQTLASSKARCLNVAFERQSMSDGKGDRVNLKYACDKGETLAGNGSGRASAKRFDVQLESRYTPPVAGVAQIRQTMSATLVGVCTAPTDVDAMEVAPDAAVPTSPASPVSPTAPKQ